MRNIFKVVSVAVAAGMIAGPVPLGQYRALAATTPSIEQVIGDVAHATAYQNGARDNELNRMETAKIIANPAGGYLAVYHTQNPDPSNTYTVRLAISNDLLNWTVRTVLDDRASQPTIQPLDDGGFLTVAEYNDGSHGGKLRFRHYANLAALYANNFRESTIERTLAPNCSEGTPNIESVALNPNIDTSTIKIGYHYHQGNCNVDRQAHGTLTNFSAWSGTADTALDGALTTAAAAVGETVSGNIGDRDTFAFDGSTYSLHEVQYKNAAVVGVPEAFRSWRLYLYNWQTGTASYLPITTHGGSTAFANPTVTVLTAPSGRPAVVVTLFIPSEAAHINPQNGQSEANELIYYREFTTVGGPGTGLSATYFDNQDFTGSTLSRIDPQVSFDWGQGPASANLGADSFTVRWSGRVVPDKTEAYTFYTQADDGTRLWVNGVQLIDDWTNHGVVERSGTINLLAGVPYDLKLEYFDGSAGALVRLLWSSPTTPKAIIPTDRLLKPATGLTANYFNTTNLTGPGHTRNDTNVNFNWGAGFADPNVRADDFSVRWTGKVTSAFTQTYRFYTNTDDGVRLWVNGTMLVNDWTDHGPVERSAAIALTAGQSYDIKLEYYDHGAGALATLSWSSASVPKQIIPREALAP